MQCEELDLEDIPLIWDVSFANEDLDVSQGQKAAAPTRLCQFEGIVSKPCKTAEWLKKLETNNNNNGCDSACCQSDSPWKKRKLALSKSSNKLNGLIENKQCSKNIPVRSMNLQVKLKRDFNFDKSGQSTLRMPKLDPSNRVPTYSEYNEWRIESQYGCTDISDPPTLSPEAPVILPSKPFVHEKRRESDTLTELQEYFLAQTDTIILESYYFGELSGKALAAPEHYKFLKCPMCAKCFNSNAEIYGHLYSHAAGTGKRACGHTWCPYCLEPQTPKLLKLHVKTVHHVVRENRFTCQICEEMFKRKYDLAVHMWKNHCQSDMPYGCSLCDYRSSVRFQVIDHFHKAHVPAPFVQCPVCLKVLPAYSEQDLSEILAHAQLHHVVKGQKCKHCALVYTGKNELNHHYRTGAHTCKQRGTVNREILPYQNLFRIKRLRIPKPPESLVNASIDLKTKKHRIYSQICELSLNMQVGQETCLECGQQLNAAGHFLGVMTCAKCNFNTCCQNAMFTHYDTTHRHKRRYLGMPKLQLNTCALLEKKLSCACGYQSSHPNRFARHLALCNEGSVSF